MAILEGVTVQVLVDNEPATEYDDPDFPEEEHVTSKYIEVEAGKSFELRLNSSDPTLSGCYQGLNFKIHVDGVCMAGKYSTASSPDTKFIGPYVWERGQHSFQSMTFAEIVQNFDANLPGHIIKEYEQKFSSVGTVDVRVYRCTFISQARPATKEDCRDTRALQLKDITVPQKSLVKKMNQLRSQLSGGSHVKATMSYCNLADDEPWLRFGFTYRTRGALQSLGIIPRSPSPPDLSSLRVDRMTRKQMAEYLKKAQRHQGFSNQAQNGEAVSGVKKEERRDATRREPESGVKDELSVISTSTLGKRSRSHASEGIEFVDEITRDAKRKAVVAAAVDVVEIED